MQQNQNYKETDIINYINALCRCMQRPCNVTKQFIIRNSKNTGKYAATYNQIFLGTVVTNEAIWLF